MGICSCQLFCLTGNCIAFPIKQKALRVGRTAAEQNLSLREPPQAENPAVQDSILAFYNYFRKNLFDSLPVHIYNLTQLDKYLTGVDI